MLEKFKKNFIIKILISTILWILYLEINPKIGNILLRMDSNNKIRFLPMSLVNLIVKPFFMKELWNLKVFDLNFYLVTIFNIIIFTFFENIYLDKNILSL